MIDAILDQHFMNELSDKARQAPRLRSHANLHGSYEDKVQRVCIAIEPGSYVRPHAHFEKDKWEFISVLRGAVDYLVFAKDGTLQQRLTLSAGGTVPAMEVASQTWHGLIALQTGTVIFEVKQGPFNADSIAEFADWAPAENTPAVKPFLSKLQTLAVGEKISADEA